MALDGDNDNLEYDFLNAMPDHSTFVYFHSEPSFQHAAEASKPMTYPPFVSYQNAYPMRNPVDDTGMQVPMMSISSGYQSQGSSLPFANFGTYDPFQGSPLEISNFSFLESREPLKEEEPPAVQPVPVVEPVAEPAPPKVEPFEEVQSKRSYKDVLTIPPSPTLQPKSAANQKNEEEPVVDVGKPKLVNVKTEVLPNTPKHSAKTSLNNYRVQVNTNPRKPLKINNNLSAVSAKKGNNKVEEKNLHTSNESVRSVPSQTDFASIKRKPPSTVIKDISFETPPSDDEKNKLCVTSRAVKDRKKNEKNRVKVKENHHDRSVNRKPVKKSPNSNQGPLCTKTYVQKVFRLCAWFCMWVVNLFTDVLRMSADLLILRMKEANGRVQESLLKCYNWTVAQLKKGCHYLKSNYPILKQKIVKFLRRDSNANQSNGRLGGLKANIALPASGEEAIQRLLACKGGDPYSILGVRRDCPDEEIRRYYKRQAVLVHPDKNRQRGAEEAFKILAHAFELVGHPERRSHYDRLVQQADEMESAWAELNELLSQLHAKMDETANTIRCTNCSKRHRRTKTERPCYAARYCQDCKIHHSAREGDLWAESYCMGLRSKYYACMEGAVYDITEWAFCQAGHLRHLQCNSHRVQYRIVPGQGQTNGRKA